MDLTRFIFDFYKLPLYTQGGCKPYFSSYDYSRRFSTQDSPENRQVGGETSETT